MDNVFVCDGDLSLQVLDNLAMVVKDIVGLLSDPFELGRW